MKKYFKSFLFTAFMVAVSVTLQAQTKKKQGAAKSRTATTAAKSSASGRLTSAGANQIIVYINSIGDFFGGYFNLKHVAEYSSNVKTAFNERGQRTRTAVYDSYRNVDSIDDALARFKSYAAAAKSQGKVKVDPTLPPAVVGAANVAALTTEWQNFKTAYQECLAARENIRQYVDSDLELREKKNADNLKNAINDYDVKVDAFYAVVDNIYNKMEELGDMAEEVTLEKHPMKNEIMDLRRTLRAGQAINKTIAKYDDPAAIEPKLGEISELNNKLKEFVTKYSAYDYESGKTPQIKYMKGSIKSFFEIAERMSKDIDNLPNEYKTNLSNIELKTKQNASLLSNDYQEFIQRNNSY